MNWLKVILLVILSVGIVFGQNKPEFLKFKLRAGFTGDEDTIEKYKFLDGGRKLVIVGQRNVQIWDVANAKRLSSFSYNAAEYSRTGKTAAILTLGLTTLVKWATIEIDPQGKWFAAIENSGSEKKAVVRDLQTGSQLAELDSKDFLIDIKLDGREVAIEGDDPVTYEKKNEETKITLWNGASFEPQSAILTGKCCAWSRFIKNNEINCIQSTWNSEHTLLSLNGKFVVRYGCGSVLSIFDTEKGESVEQPVNSGKERYDKRNKIKGSGFGDAEFSENGEYLFAFDSSKWYGSRTITF